MQSGREASCTAVSQCVLLVETCGQGPTRGDSSAGVEGNGVTERNPVSVIPASVESRLQGNVHFASIHVSIVLVFYSTCTVFVNKTHSRKSCKTRALPGGFPPARVSWALRSLGMAVTALPGGPGPILDAVLSASLSVSPRKMGIMMLS